MTAEAPSAKIFVAVRSDEFQRLFHPDSQEALQQLGEVTFGEGDPRVALPDGLADDYDVLVTSWSTEPFPPEVMQGSRLKFAIHSAGSIRKLFPKSVIESGLRVAQGGSDAMALPVAEMALTLTLTLIRNLHTHDRQLQATKDWKAGGNGMLGNGLQFQHVGILGLSRTGQHYARMMQGLGVHRVSAYDPYASPEMAASLGVELLGLEEVMAECDVVAIHLPVTDETRGMLDAAKLALMKDDAVVINTARSAVVDEAALLAELTAGRLRAGLDVFDQEPLPADSAFYGLPNVLLMPHVAGGTVEARHQQGATVVAEIRRFLDGEPLSHEVTAQIYDRLS